MQNITDDKRKKILEKIQQFCLLDDDFMTKCFEDNKECTELILQIIMGKSDLKVVKSRTQHTIKNLQGRSVRLDIDAVDSEGKEYDIEIQRNKHTAVSIILSPIIFFNRFRLNKSVVKPIPNKITDTAS